RMSLVRRDARKALLVADSSREGFGLPEIAQRPIEFQEHKHSVSELESKIDGLLDAHLILWQPREHGQRLVEKGGSFPIGASADGLCARLGQVRSGPLPQLTAQCMVGEPLDVLSHP